MQTSLTAVIEQSNTYRGNFETEPYEAAWVSEARWFVNVQELSGERIVFYPEISPDGLVWCRLELNLYLAFDRSGGMQSLSIDHFGHWLRLRVEQPEESTAKVLIYLALKG